MNLKAIALGVLALTAVHAHAYQAREVAGIKLGVAVAPQRAAIMKANPSYRITEVRDYNGQVIGVRGVAGKGKQVTAHLLVLHTDRGLVWFVGREQQLPESGRIVVDTFVSSVKAKFGEPSSSVNILKWYFDRGGKRLSGGLGQSLCVPDRRHNSRSDLGQIDELRLNVPAKFGSGCGLMAESRYVESPTKGLISAFSVQVADVALQYDALTARQNQADAERKKVIDAARANKPSL